MAIRPVNPELVLRELDRRMAGYGNGARLAEELGVYAAHLRAMRSGNQAVTEKVARGLGFELRWVRKGQVGQVGQGRQGGQGDGRGEPSSQSNQSNQSNPR